MTDGDIKYYNAWTEAMEMETKPRRLLCLWHIIKNWNIQGRSKFHQLKENYLNHLENDGETEFLKYLLNAGINTNMALESLNKVLKYNKMKGQRNIRVDKLLDLLEGLVDDRMCKRIATIERPNANNYQHRVNIEEHRKAESQLINKINIMEVGKFSVKSTSKASNPHYKKF
ncbi:hypothetical protein ABEB36_014151 [Hypothenemus hampei]|uniref:MULE transposase domain-containing protein n=1 Tax=Hypothenemus hampei TaxID=57062 RepID=A0ABD1E3G0_HYPHA